MAPVRFDWAELADLPAGLFLEGPADDSCALARELDQWVAAELELLGERATSTAFNQLRLRVVDAYFALRARAPYAHRDRLGVKHRCLYRAFVEAHELVEGLRLRRHPPLVEDPPPPPVPRSLEVNGVWFGEEEGNG